MPIGILPLLVACAATPPPEPPPPPGPERIAVSHPRELRAVWVATVANIDFPTKPGLPVETQRAELLSLLDTLHDLNFNAVYFQVRASADAMYDSPLEPWSRALTGHEGEDPGWDPLAELVTEGHARSIEVHAWLNPYRAATTRVAHDPNHVSQLNPDWVVPYGSLLWIDPGRDEAREHLLGVVDDLVRRYDLDGIHFDDYFYPYPEKGRTFEDADTHAAYRKAGGELEREDWRVQNVNRMVASVAETVQRRRETVRFGVSPFGIYRPGIPEGVRGLDQVASLHADPLAWKDDVDYLAPQLYWPTTREHQPFGTLAAWWSDQADRSTDVYVGLYLSQIGTTPAWTLDEYATQVRLAREAPGVVGQAWFSARPLMEDRGGVQALIRDELYREPALPPPVARLSGQTVPPPIVTLVEGSVRVAQAEGARRLAVYRLDEAGPRLDRVLPGNQRRLELPVGSWAIAAVAPSGVESEGAVIRVP